MNIERGKESNLTPAVQKLRDVMTLIQYVLIYSGQRMKFFYKEKDRWYFSFWPFYILDREKRIFLLEHQRGFLEFLDKLRNKHLRLEDNKYEIDAMTLFNVLKSIVVEVIFFTKKDFEKDLIQRQLIHLQNLYKKYYEDIPKEIRGLILDFIQYIQEKINNNQEKISNSSK